MKLNAAQVKQTLDQMNAQVQASRIPTVERHYHNRPRRRVGVSRRSKPSQAEVVVFFRG